MKKLLLTILFTLVLSGGAYSSEDLNFICQKQRSNGTLHPTKYFYEFKKNKLYIDGINYKLNIKPKINETSILFNYKDNYIYDVSINKKTGTMVEKIYDGLNDPNPGLVYYKCEIF